jgi:hypothetical protein
LDYVSEQAYVFKVGQWQLFELIGMEKCLRFRVKSHHPVGIHSTHHVRRPAEQVRMNRIVKGDKPNKMKPAAG